MGYLAKLLREDDTRPTAPETVTETIEPDIGPGSYVQSVVLKEPVRDARDLLERFGHDPEKVGLRAGFSVSHRELVSGAVVSTFRYECVQKPDRTDVDALIGRVRAAAPAFVPVVYDDHWFVFQAGDLQIGKRASGGSTEQIVETYLESVERAVNLYRLFGGLAGVQISMPGDCIEGIVSQNGKNAWLTQETITEQTRILRRLMLHTVDEFAKVAPKVYLDVVGGNHDEAQRQWNTYPGDNWATEAAITVQDMLRLNPDAYSHVEVRVPDKWSGHMTVPVGDTNVTIVHGHQWRPGQAMKWWMEQCFGGHDPAGAHLLQNGHYHEVGMERNGDRTRVQSPTFDTGSDWYRELHGVGNTRGALTYLLRSGEVSNLTLV